MISIFSTTWEQTTHTYHTPLRVMPAEHIVVRCFSCHLFGNRTVAGWLMQLRLFQVASEYHVNIPLKINMEPPNSSNCKGTSFSQSPLFWFDVEFSRLYNFFFHEFQAIPRLVVVLFSVEASTVSAKTFQCIFVFQKDMFQAASCW